MHKDTQKKYQRFIRPQGWESNTGAVWLFWATPFRISSLWIWTQSKREQRWNMSIFPSVQFYPWPAEGALTSTPNIWPSLYLNSQHFTHNASIQTTSLKGWKSTAPSLKCVQGLKLCHVRRFLMSRPRPLKAQRCGRTTGCALGQVSWELDCWSRPDKAEPSVAPSHQPLRGNASMCLNRPQNECGYFQTQGPPIRNNYLCLYVCVHVH